ncbi:Dicer-like protein 1 [Massospora cicadina]|nr:Dicer-like protein 1 [Massospora cicadina]
MEVTDMHQLVLEVEKVSLAYNYLARGTTTSKKKQGYHTKISLLPEFCCVYWLSASILCSEVKCNLNIDFVRDELLLEVFTYTTANVSMDYEWLELLGDSYLKLIATLNIYVHFPNLHKGELHCQCVKIIKNHMMVHAAKEWKLPAYFITQPFNRRLWCPPSVTFENVPPPGPRLGASLLTFGRKHYMLVETNNHKPPKLFDVAKIQSIIGYTFNYANLLMPSYQQLKFLGDAILDYFVVFYLFHKYLDVSPGCFADMKGTCISNNALAAILETLDLHRHIMHSSTELKHAMEEFMLTMAELQTQCEATKDGMPKGEYWFDTNVPNVISNVLEVTIGAVCVDFRFDVNVAQGIFACLIQPLYNNHTAPYHVIVHPVAQLNWFVQCFGCQKLNIVCEVLGAEEKYQRPQGTHAASKMARKHAAQDALDWVKKDPKLLHPLCDYPSRQINEKDVYDLATTSHEM